MKNAIAILALLLVAGGCFLESPIDDQNIKAAKARAETQRMIAEYQRDSTRIALERASDRAAAHADSMMAWNPARADTVLIGPSYAAAKVAAAMADNGITLPQVAAFLSTHGFDVINRSEFKRWHWSPPVDGAPVAYYVVNFRVAIGDTTLPVYIPQTAGPYWIRVKAYDGLGNSGPWSETNTSAAGDLLPGVVE